MSKRCGRSSRTCAPEGSAIRCSWFPTGRPASSVRSRSASLARPASAASRIECAISPPGLGRSMARPRVGEPGIKAGHRLLSGDLARDRPTIGGRYPRRLRQRSAKRARLFRRRFRSLHCAPALAGHASPLCTDNKPPRTAVRRGTAKAQDHSERLRREAGAQAHVRRAHPSRGALARPTLYRVRAPPDRRRRKGTQRRISGFNHATGNVNPAPSFQQIQALTNQSDD
jgi:hypothetical protein